MTKDLSARLHKALFLSAQGAGKAAPHLSHFQVRFIEKAQMNRTSVGTKTVGDQSHLQEE